MARARKGETPAQPAGQGPTAGMKGRIERKDSKEMFQPTPTERVVRTYLKKRRDEMKEYRKGLRVEDRWKEADEEYIPHELDFGTTRKRFETDQDTGLRSRMVPVGDITQQWRQASSAPTLLAKIHTAISIIIDQQPEAELVALVKKYSATTDLAYALWKRNWQITDAKEKLKIIVFDLFKYGWKPQRTFPRHVKFDKRVLSFVDKENPENNRYEEKEVTWFNDIDRQPLDVFHTWIDELSRPYDPLSTNECYYELDYSWDDFQREFGDYPNARFVKHDSKVVEPETHRKTNRSSQNEESMKRRDIVTVGFFESRTKDIFAIHVPVGDILVYASPLPNDEGYISLTHTMLLLRKGMLPYGVSLWEVIRQNKMLYDKMKNMTMDQLVLSIMKFGMFAGTNPAIGDGKIEIIPGQMRQVTTSTGKLDWQWMEIPGPGEGSFKGLEIIAKMMDDESGISPTLEGEITGKTLGEILHAKEAGLKRLKVPVENIAWLIEQDAYLTLSWMAQVYAIPTIMQFSTMEELLAWEKEEQIEHTEIWASKGENGEAQGPYEGHFLPQLSLHLEDENGQLREGKESKFFQVGTRDGQIHPGKLKWKGIFKVIPRSIVDSSQELMKAVKMEMFNMIVPLLQFPPELAAKAVRQVLKINEEDPDDWLPDAWVDYLKNGPQPPQGGLPDMFTQGPQGGAAPAAGGAPPEMPKPEGGERGTIQGSEGLTPPQAAKIVPGGPGPTIQQLGGGKPGLFNKRM